MLFDFIHLMKKLARILFLIVIATNLSSCVIEEHHDLADNVNQISLGQLIQSYDLWYVDFGSTSGTGDIPFLSRAFTLSFMNDGHVYANNNIAGIGVTGNGFGIDIGTFAVFNRNGILEVNHIIDGTVPLEVRQLSLNEIELYSRSENVKYILIGYQKSEFDYDRLFYENITYFLQEYEAWSKSYQEASLPSPFNFENILNFYAGSNADIFRTSEDTPNTPIANILWNYSGTYSVLNTSAQDVKRLELSYTSVSGFEKFELTILNDQKIRLQNLFTNNVYEFEGRGYIQYLRPQRNLRTSKKIEKNHFLKV